jgi:hypothetical protein
VQPTQAVNHHFEPYVNGLVVQGFGVGTGQGLSGLPTTAAAGPGWPPPRP